MHANNCYSNNNMKREQVRSGRLYYNKSRKQVEQVRGHASGASVITARKQDGMAMVAKAEDLRRASKREVDSYLDS
jgi:hypothetical protein